MRELEVAATPLHVEVLAELGESDGRALDVPAGAPGSERRLPRGLAGPAVFELFVLTGMLLNVFPKS